MAFYGQRLQLHLAAPSTEQPILVAPSPPLPAFCRFLDNAHPSHDGSTIWGTVKDLPAFDVLLSTIHDEEKVQFSKVRTCQQSTKAGIFTVRHDFQCRMAGAPCNISLRRGKPIVRRASIRSQKCGCPATITFWDSPGNPVRVRIELLHRGHVPGGLVDKSNLTMHERYVALTEGCLRRQA